MSKKFRLAPGQIRRLIGPLGRCIASDMITVDGEPIGYMYREPPQDETDSGWVFFAGTESDQYNSNAGNFSIYDVNTICNYDPAIIPYLGEAPGFGFVRRKGMPQFDREVLKAE
jgi:hypothetical protein